METRRLNAFIRMVDLGSLTRAAHLLNIAQPALSQQLVALEADFGTQLLTRSRHGVVPTSAGRALYRHAQAILKLLEQAHVEVKQAREDVSGVVTIGLPLTAAAILSAPLLAVVRARYPNVTIQLADGLPGNLLNELAMNGRVDISLLPGNVSANGVGVHPLLTERLAFVTSKEAKLGSDDGPVRVRDLEGVPLVLPASNNRVRQAVDSAFASVGLRPTVVAEMNSIYSLCSAAAANVGSTIVPFAGARVAAPNLCIRLVTEPEIERPIHIAVSDAAPLTAPALAVYALILDTVAELIEAGDWPSARLVQRVAA
ncbi:MAG TPA: LysR substrate-binding domain-containing protein [Rhizomicrobium sp.]|jgi:LysR family nitrogen assimilation transcriptional regulator|nr:LysR substrate-binding domain-containing protein [Rhizomicrobium sp.]